MALYIPIDTDTGGTGLVTVKLHAGGHFHLFVIDTGSNRSHVHTVTAECLLQARRETVDTVSTMGVCGNMTSKERLTQVFHNGPVTIEHTFLVSDLGELVHTVTAADGPYISGILGTDFLKKYRCHLDFKKNRLHFG